MLASSFRRAGSRTRFTLLLTALMGAMAFAAWLSAPAQAQEGSTETIELTPGWTLTGWLGPSNISIAEALENNEGPAGDLSDAVTAVWTWDSPAQAWRGYFPGTEHIPGANDFTTFTRQVPYWIAYNGDEVTNWIIPTD